MAKARLEEWITLFGRLNVGMLALYVLVGFLVVEHLLKDLKEGISVETKKLLHEALVRAEPDYVHCVEAPTLLTKTTLGEFLTLEEQLDHPKNLVANVGRTVFNFEF